MFRGARNLLRPLHAQRFQILEKRVDILFGVFADRDPRLHRVADDLVVHVGNVHHVAHGDAGQAQKAPQNIDLQKRAEVANVAVIVDRRPARVHAQRLAVGRLERIQLSREGIKQAEGHRFQVLRPAHGGRGPPRNGLLDSNKCGAANHLEAAANGNVPANTPQAQRLLTPRFSAGEAIA